ncbi:MAG: methyl-accepting chemotaxis protein [[Clostridium] cellulosi]
MSKDLKSLEFYLDRLADGDFSFSIDNKLLKKKNKAGKMARLVKTIADKERKKAEALKNLSDGNFEACSIADSDDISLSCIAEIASSLKNINNQIESINERIGNGDTAARLNTRSKGGYRQIALGVNKILDAESESLCAANEMVKSMCLNDFSVQMVTGFTGVFEELAQGLNKLREKFIEIQQRFTQISDGNFDGIEHMRENGALSENDGLTPAVIKAFDTLNAFVNFAGGAAQNCAQGVLSGAETGEYEFTGKYKAAAEDITRAIGTVSLLLKEYTRVLSAMSVNDLTMQFDQKFAGDFAQLSKAAEDLRSRMLYIESTLKQIAQGNAGAVELNETEPLNENDGLTPALKILTENLKSVENVAAQISDAAAEGNLSFHISTDNVGGGVAKLYSALNTMFSSISEQLNEISSVIEKLVSGDTSVEITEDYKGIFGKLKDNLNALILENREIVSLTTDILNGIADGNLDIDTIKDLPGDWNGIPHALNNIVKTMNELIGNIHNAVNEVAASANQVASASQALSQGAAEQASSIEELTASISEIAAKTKNNAINAGEASNLAKAMRESAISGNKEMSEMLTSMKEINESSQNISKIIKVIDDIAFQTNLLSLNAAVEAARAGQHGKGFAVVAEEVRNLAVRSANAAKDTTELIEGSIKRVEKGTQIASDTAKTLGDIVSSVDKVAGLIENIAAASNEQATGITQINQSLEQVSKVVQTNSATAEQSAAASQELSGQAGLLKGNVEKFKLKVKVPPKAESIPVKAEIHDDIDEKIDEKKDTSLNNDFGKY